MIGAVVLLRDVAYDWWPAKVWAEDPDDIVQAAQVTAVCLRETYGEHADQVLREFYSDILRDSGRKRSLLEGGGTSEGD